jgi:hypothetical protein
MIWYKFHIGDYMTHTIHLDDAEDLAYRRLLDLYYLSEKPLSLDIAVVAKKVRLDADIVEPILKEFFELTEEGYRNFRADAEIEKYNAKCEFNRSVAGRRSAKKASGEPNANLTETETETDKTISSARFDEFWTLWPSSKRKVGKAACETKWKRHKLDAIADRILAHVAELKGSEQWLSGFEPAPMTYLNQKRWEDAATQQTVGRRAI